MIGTGAETDLLTNQSAAKTPAMAKLVKGPASAIRTSRPASFGSSRISETPPKKKRVILAIGSPFFFAMNEPDSTSRRTHGTSMKGEGAPIAAQVVDTST